MGESAEDEDVAERERRERTEKQLRLLGSNPANSMSMDAKRALQETAAEPGLRVWVPSPAVQTADDLLAELDRPLEASEARTAEAAATSLPGPTKPVTFDPHPPTDQAGKRAASTRRQHVRGSQPSPYPCAPAHRGVA